MTAIKNTTGRVRRPTAHIGLAAGLLLGLSACAGAYETACTEAGHQPGSAAFSACVQDKIDTARVERRRHLKYGSGG